MNKAELIEKVATEAGMTKAQTEKILDCTIDNIRKSVKKGDEVKLVGFGTFIKAKRKARTGRNPQTGEIVSWFFGANGGYGTGVWHREDKRWYIQTEGVAADGTPTAALNILYKAGDDVVSWQSTRRVLGDTQLPDVKEMVIERVKATK